MEMLNYFLEVSLFWAGFWVLYAIAFRQEKFFGINRIYLLGSLGLGVLLPLVSWPQMFPEAPQVLIPTVWLEAVLVEGAGTAAVADVATTPWLKYLYYGTCLIVGARLLYGMIQLIQKIRNSQRRIENDICWVISKDMQAPFSWFWFLFWNDDLSLPTAEKQAIIAHERAHMKQYHSWDILAVEFLGVFFWWNPLWYFYKSAIQTNHEYLADEAALESTPVRDYGHLLIRQSFAAPAMQLVQPFYPSQLKNRIMMMTKNASPNHTMWKYLLTLPLAFVLILACSENTGQEELTEAVNAQTNADSYEVIDTITTFNPETMKEVVSIEKYDVYEKVEQMPVFGACGDVKKDEREKCSKNNLFTYIYQNVRYPKEASEAGEEGTVALQFIVDKEGELLYGNAEIKKSSGSESLDAEALRVVESLSGFQAGELNGEAVNVQMVLPIKFRLE